MKERYEVTALGPVTSHSVAIDADLDLLMDRLQALGAVDPFVGFSDSPIPGQAELEIIVTVFAGDKKEALALGSGLIEKAMGVIEDHAHASIREGRAELLPA